MRQSAQRRDAYEPPPAAEARETLFRHEVVSERQTKWLGTVLLQPRVSHRVFAGVAIAAILAVFAFLLLGSFTRKARVNGWLVPREGLVKVFAPQAGIVTALKVHEGETVAKGTPLLIISAELCSVAQGPARAQAVERLSSGCWTASIFISSRANR